MTTERLYLADPYITSFTAKIIDTCETEHGPAVVFASTHFYPESGGQPYDLGTIDGIPVTRIVETDDHRVLHFVDRLPERNDVHCEIDGARRRDHMQQHCGQHILSAAFVREAAAATTSFHLGATVSTIDLDKAGLSEAEVSRTESAANAVVRAAAPIESRFVSGDEARTLDLRKDPPRGERLRIVSVEGFDQQACCGTHPCSTAEVGIVVVRGVERFKGGTRVEFLCGDRALADYRTSVGRIRKLASVLSTAESELVETATRLKDERKSMDKELRKLRSDALVAGAEAWMENATVLGEATVLSKIAEGLEPAALRTLASKLVEAPGRVVLLGSIAEARAHLVFARSEDGAHDMGRLLREAVGAVGGKGGGSPQIAQGGGPNTDGLESAMSTALHALSGERQ